MKRFLFFAIIIFLTAQSFPQKIDVLDTIKVAALQDFNAPSVGALVLANILKLDYSAELLNTNLQKIRDVKKATQKPKREDMPKAVQGGRGTTVWIVFSDMIEEPGNYYIKISLTASGELGGLKKDVYYYIQVSNPSLATAINIRPSYYFGEKESFSFATVEYTDPNAYSYEILDGTNVVYKSISPFVKLDSILRVPANVGKTFKVRGMYQGKEFTFKSPGTGKIEKSNWQFSVERPGLQEFNGWEKKENDQWLVSVYNSLATQFWYVYIGKTPSGFAVTIPDLNGLRITSEPENFISGFTQRNIGSFKVVELTINEEFLNQMPVGESKSVKVHVSYRTQFGESFSRDYYAVVIR